jgi:ABC-type Fe3+/spermidine/putrescine transport system ATPase subunit
MANILDIKNVTKIFRGGVLAVDDVMLGVEEGEFLTILGPSGCLFARAHEIWSDAVE